jgi:formamidopyrimidine-DNA glycosylase
MPELPEVQTTVEGINKTVKGLRVNDVWTSYESQYYKDKESVKCPKYFKKFKEAVTGAKIVSAQRRAKNIIINLENGISVLIHMKMTGHIMYGKYVFDKELSKDRIKNDPWKPDKSESEALRDPFNRHIRLVFSLSNKKHLVLSDTRKFAKVVFLNTENMYHTPHLSHLGPEPLDKTTTYEVFKKQISKKPEGRIKNVLMDQTLLSGVGNIYSDEALWSSSIHPETKPKNIPEENFKKLYKSTLDVLSKGIDFGGDSMSDYRNIHGEKGAFQTKHNAYRKTGKKCSFKNCDGVITRKVVGGRSSHFCNKHQIKF